MQRYTIAIHGGAGTISKEDMTPEQERDYLKGLEEALRGGYAVLEGGGTALAAVKAAVMLLEDNPLFNAGRGSVFTHEGLHEMDASIMDGSTLKAGAVACVRNVRNPIELAAEVMEHSSHVFLAGSGAQEFARFRGLRLEPDDYFFTSFRFSQLEEIRHTDTFSLDHKGKKIGTVGAVACDGQGHVAAATSTGGMTNKKFGRVGDSPVIGGGTYANDTTCAISCTGEGEVFIKAVAAYDVSCLMEYRGLNLQQAMELVVNEKLVRMKGEGGIIGVDPRGEAVLLMNSPGMYRGVQSSDGRFEVAIYR
ncbi:isoaspartyl peptidase/L-asparaginase [Paraflavisolibacter sp. H34]|uniref:isoaspartyl peptidase/L-asparaginase family protein n=1 Tax=Huijunlia imazamoxiresistens TaxID=3127457 RepID=UPI0030198060